MTGAVADGAIMEGCGSVEEAKAFREILAQGASQGRPRSRGGQGDRPAQRLHRGRRQDGARRRAARRRPHAGGRPAEVPDRRGAGAAPCPPRPIAPFANVHYAAGAAPYAPLLPLVTDRHVDAFTLAGTVEEVAQHMLALRAAGIDGFIIMPFAPEGGTAEATMAEMGSRVWPMVKKQG